MKLRRTARMSTGGRAPRIQLGHHQVWHPALTTAAEEGEERLEAAVDAKVERDGELVYNTSVDESLPHSGSRQPSGLRVAEVPASPFPPRSSFGIVPYAVWHGHHAVVDAYLEELDADVDGTAMVPAEPRQAVGPDGDPPAEQDTAHTVEAQALQIAVWKRDTRMVKLLLAHGADSKKPFLLDTTPPRTNTLFASKEGHWSREGFFCYPPAFRAAVRQLLLISHKFGGVRRRDGQLRWAFHVGLLETLLLPILGRGGSIQPWITGDDWLPAVAAGSDGSVEDESDDAGQD